MAIECPICQNIVREQLATICPKCNWDLTLYSFTPDDISKALIKQIDWSRQMWKNQQKSLQEIEVLKASYNKIFEIGVLVNHRYWEKACELTAWEIFKTATNKDDYTIYSSDKIFNSSSSNIKILKSSFIKNLDFELLSNIDKAWVDNTRGYHGLLVQKSIFEKILRTHKDEDEYFIWSLFTIEVGWKQPEDVNYWKQLKQDRSYSGQYYFRSWDRDYIKNPKNFKVFNFSNLMSRDSFRGHFPLLNWLISCTGSPYWKDLINGIEGYEGFKALMDRFN